MSTDGSSGLNDDPKRLTVREEWVEITHQDLEAALVLEQLLQWQRWVHDRTDRDGWIQKSRSNLADDLLGTKSPSTLRRRLDKLEEMQLLESRPSDDAQTSKKEWRIDYQELRSQTIDAGYDWDTLIRSSGKKSIPIPDDQTPVQCEQPLVHDEQGLSNVNNPPLSNVNNHNEDNKDHTMHTQSARSGEGSDEVRQPTKAPDISEWFDGLDQRDPLPEGRRVEFDDFSEGWKQVTGQDFGQQGDGGWHMANGPDESDMQKYRVVSAYFTPDEIRRALKKVKRSDPDYPWSYFRSTLEGQCDAYRDGDGESAAVKRMKNFVGGDDSISSEENEPSIDHYNDLAGGHS